MKRLLISLLILSACATSKPAEVAPPPKVEPPPPAVSPDPEVLADAPVPYRPFAATAPLTVVTVPSNKPIVSVRLAFRTGSVDDPQGKEGLTSLTQDLMGEATKELSSAQLLDALYPLAGELYGTTEKELTVFVGRVHKDKQERFLKIFVDTILDPRLDEKDFERLKSNALNTIKTRLRNENDEQLGKLALEAQLYAGHPYRHSVGGTVAGLESITLDDVKAQWKRVFTQDRLIIAVAGPGDAAVAKKLKAAFAKLPATGAPAVQFAAAPGPRGQTLILQRDTLSTAESFGYTTALRRGDPDFFAVALATSYLGEHRQMHGVLFGELREKRGLNYGDYAYAEHFAQEGWGSLPQVNVPRSTQDISVWIRPVEPKNGVFATRGALYFLKQLLEQPIPQEKFDTARGFLLGYTRIWEQTDQRRLGYAVDSLLYGTPKYLEQFRAALEKMTPQQMQDAAKKHLTPEAFNFVYVTKDADALAKQLKERTASPISYPTPKAAEVLEVDKAIEKFALPIPSSRVQVQSAETFMQQ